jgi:hypothetical protein
VIGKQFYDSSGPRSATKYTHRGFCIHPDQCLV